jgi:hypothetical protein
VAHVAVTVLFLGSVVESRVVRLREGMVFGDAYRPAVSFPNATLVVAKDARGWTAGGHRLVPGRSLVLSFGDFEVSMEGLPEGNGIFPRSSGPDLSLVLATCAVLLMAAWWDVMSVVVSQNPQATQQITALVFSPVEASPSDELFEPLDTATPTSEDGWSPPVGFAIEAPEG